MLLFRSNLPMLTYAPKVDLAADQDAPCELQPSLHIALTWRSAQTLSAEDPETGATLAWRFAIALWSSHRADLPVTALKVCTYGQGFSIVYCLRGLMLPSTMDRNIICCTLLCSNMTRLHAVLKEQGAVIAAPAITMDHLLAALYQR